MEVRKINSISSAKPALRQVPANADKELTFKGNSSGSMSNTAKKGWLTLRRLANQMKDITEIKNAVIAAIGTGIIAPAIILVSPGKGDKEDKDKKFLQALRQPLSAVLAFGFQVPATTFITHEVNKLGFEKKLNMFKDEIIGDLIPNEKYLAKEITKDELNEAIELFDDPEKGKELREKLKAEIERDYKEVNLEIPENKLEQRMQKDKVKFLEKEIARNRHDELVKEKIDDIIKNKDKYPKVYEKIKDKMNLVTGDLQSLAEEWRVCDEYFAEYNKLEANANLSFFDRMMRTLGFDTKKTKELENLQKEFKKKKGLDILLKQNPGIEADHNKQIENFIKTYQKDAEKIFNNKIFWISLLVNLFMVTASCYALNWLHPRVNNYIENRKAAKNNANVQKAEVA